MNATNRLQVAVAGFCLALVVIIWVATVQRIAHEHTQALREETRELSNLAIAYEEHTLRTLRDIDQVLSLIEDAYERRGPDVDIQRLVEAGRFDASLFANIAIVDPSGRLVRGFIPGAQIDVSDRDYFKVHLRRDNREMFIGAPILGRITDKWVIPASRRLTRPDGSFAGVVYMAVDPSYFGSFYRRIDAGPEGLTMLVGLDGIVRVRQVGESTSLGEDIRGSSLLEAVSAARAGSFVSKGRLDGIPRLNSYRVMEGYPLVVTLGTSLSVLTSRIEERRNIYLVSASLVTLFIIVGAVTVMRTVQRRNQALVALRESEERFRAMVEQSISGIYILQDGMLTYVNPRLAEIGGYEPHELVGKPVLDLVPPELRARLELEMAQRLRGTAEVGQYTLTLRRKDGSPVDVAIHATRAVVEGKPAIIGIVQDVSERKVAEQVTQRHALQLETALIETIEAVATMVELKDPYTAGHERSVGDIAAAIGQELGLDSEQVKGLRYAGYVHDIGKIAIPTELLSKPGKLTLHEFELIKTHAQQGYDVLKDIKFPWPIARAILEHHERLDGSGYPRALKGDEISLEARILAVADTVEAMSSHRPYRPALGLDAALREIEAQAGKRYDPRVAAACLRLFRQGRVRLAA